MVPPPARPARPAPPAPPSPAPEQRLVELVDRSGQAVGSATVAQAHTAPGRLHRAFSVLLVAPDRQRLLLQQRAAGKTRFPLRWANTCCGHPAPREPVTVAATRRLAEEIRLTGIPLTEIGVWCYRAGDPASGGVEHEYDHVLLGELAPEQPLAPDPAEVAGLRWVDPPGLAELLRARPGACAPWLAGVVGPLATVAGPHWAVTADGAG